MEYAKSVVSACTMCPYGRKKMIQRFFVACDDFIKANSRFCATVCWYVVVAAQV